MNAKMKAEIDELIARYRTAKGALKGARPEELKAIEDKYSIKFPEAYKYFLLQCDGLDEFHVIEDEYGDVEDTVEANICGVKDILDSWPQKYMLSKGWIPYHQNSLGDYFCVEWKSGNTTLWDHEEPESLKYDKGSSNDANFERFCKDLLQELGVAVEIVEGAYDEDEFGDEFEDELEDGEDYGVEIVQID